MKDQHINVNKNVKKIKDSNNVFVWMVTIIIVLAGIYFLWAKSESTQKVIAPTVSTSTEAVSGVKTQKTATQKNKSATIHVSADTEPTARASVSSRYAGVGPLSSLFSLKESLVCSVEMQSAYTKRNGTVYVSGNKLRGNFNSYIDGVLTYTNMIDSGGYLYVWEKNETKGITIPAPLLSGGNAIILAGGISLSSQISYHCNLWTPDTSKFIKPTNITFVSPGS